MPDRDKLIELLCKAPLGFKTFENYYYKSTISKIADYLLANGVICTPCKVGDTIYKTDGVRIYASTIHEITYTSSKVIFVTENIVFDEQAINNLIFLTREEAEKALERSAT